MRRTDRAHDLGSRPLTQASPGPLGVTSPPAGGIDLSLPGQDIRLAATRWPGSAAGTAESPVVLLHGLASQRRFWNLVATRLAGLPVLALDQRGHGDSDRPDEGYDPTTVAGDLAIALDALGWSRVVVVGHSWGGAVAATFAAEHPERTLALVAIDGGFSSPVAADVDRNEVRRRLEPPKFALPSDQLVEMISSRTPGGVWTDEHAAAVLPIFEVGPDGLARSRLPFETHMKIVDTLLDYDATAVLTRVSCPQWLVSCDALDPEDAWTANKTAALRAVAGRLARPRILRWAGAVHDVPLQWPDLVAGLVRAAVVDAARAGGDGGLHA